MRALAMLAFACAFVPTLLAAQAGRPTIALVLSGGGARGFAHIGVLKVIEEIGLPIDIVVGSSMGSVVGGLYCSGYSPADIDALSRDVDWQWLISDARPRAAQSVADRSEEGTVFGFLSFNSGGQAIATGLLSGRRIRSLLQCLTLPASTVANFDALNPRFCSVAVDITTAREHSFRSGDIATAIRASMSTPGVFEPVKNGPALYVDGGVLNDLPVDVAIGLGADVVIAVDITTPFKGAEPVTNPITVLRRMAKTTMIQSTRRNRKLATLLITPDLGETRSTDFQNRDFIISRGEAAARAVADIMKALAPQRSRIEPRTGGRRAPALEYASVEISGGSIADRALVARAVRRTSPEKPSTVPQITPIGLFLLGQKLEGTGRYESVEYALRPNADGGKVLEVVLKEQTVKPVSVGIGAGFTYLSNGTGPVSDVHAGVVLRPGRMSTGIVDVTAGTRSGIGMNFVQEICDGFYLRPAAFHEWYAHPGLPPARSGARLSAGYRPDGALDLHTGYGVASTRGGSFDAGIEGSITLDTRDRYPAPESGTLLRLLFAAMAPELGGERTYQRILFQGQIIGTHAERHALSARIDCGFVADSIFHPTTPLQPDLLFSVGPDLIPGYAEGALSTANYAIFGVEYRFRILGVPKSVPVLIPAGIYAAIHGAIGTPWDEPGSFDPAHRLMFGGGIGLLAVSPVGTLRMEVRSSNRTSLSFALFAGTLRATF